MEFLLCLSFFDFFLLSQFKNVNFLFINSTIPNCFKRVNPKGNIVKPSNTYHSRTLTIFWRIRIVKTLLVVWEKEKTRI